MEGKRFKKKFDSNELKALMNKHSLSISVAESLTTGNIQATIGSISGASSFFEGGITAYNIDQKVNLLGVNREHAQNVNSVSQRVANEMSTGVCLKFSSILGIGTTGYAEPYLEKNIISPYAYYSICRYDFISKKVEILVEQIVTGKGLSRIEMQLYLTEIIMIKLLELVKQI